MDRDSLSVRLRPIRARLVFLVGALAQAKDGLDLNEVEGLICSLSDILADVEGLVQVVDLAGGVP